MSDGSVEWALSVDENGPLERNPGAATALDATELASSDSNEARWPLAARERELRALPGPLLAPGPDHRMKPRAVEDGQVYVEQGQRTSVC